MAIVTPCKCVGHRVNGHHNIYAVVFWLSLLLLHRCRLLHSLLFLLHRLFLLNGSELLLLLRFLSDKAKRLLLAYPESKGELRVVLLVHFHRCWTSDFGIYGFSAQLEDRRVYHTLSRILVRLLTVDKV